MTATGWRAALSDGPFSMREPVLLSVYVPCCHLWVRSQVVSSTPSRMRLKLILYVPDSAS